MLCKECVKRETCKKLCGPAKRYADQDEVKLRELTIGLPMYGNLPENVSNIPLTKMEKKIVTLLGQKLTRGDICKLLKLNRLSLRLHLFRLRKKCNENY
jgi:hypothetical protein